MTRGSNFKGNAYKILRVTENVTQKEIRKAYLTLAKRFHTDFAPKEKKDLYKEKLIRINLANEILSDPRKRKIYDQRVQLSRISKHFGQEEDLIVDGRGLFGEQFIGTVLNLMEADDVYELSSKIFRFIFGNKAGTIFDVIVNPSIKKANIRRR